MLRSRLSKSRSAEVETRRELFEYKDSQKVLQREVQRLKKSLDAVSIEKLEKEVEKERLLNQRKELELQANRDRREQKVAEIQQQEQSKINLMNRNAELKRIEQEKKKEAKAASERQKTMDDTRKFQETCSRFHSSVMSSQQHVNQFNGGTFPNLHQVSSLLVVG